jgi:hypothetical protein
MPTKMREDDLEESSNLENIEQDVTDLTGRECTGYEDIGRYQTKRRGVADRLAVTIFQIGHEHNGQHRAPCILLIFWQPIAVQSTQALLNLILYVPHAISFSRHAHSLIPEPIEPHNLVPVAVHEIV